MRPSNTPSTMDSNPLASVFRSTGPGHEKVDNAGLYVHVPFCSAICPYCDFSVARGSGSDRQQYVQALVAEISAWSAPGTRFDTVYFGGGTPSILEPQQLREIRACIERQFDLSPDCRWSLEANPEDVGDSTLEVWKQLGFASLSLGLQSLDPTNLRFLGRRHTSSVSRRCVELAVAAAVDSVSVDLIYGLPGQTEESWSRELEAVTELGPHHLSCYELTIHQGTPFHRQRERGRLALPHQDRRASLFALTHRRLGELGFGCYEVSSFARRPDLRSRHNQKYWRHVPYLGVGPAAHSFDGRHRWWNEPSWLRYAERVEGGQSARVGGESLDRTELAAEAILLAMRTRDGIDLDAFERRFGTPLQQHKVREIGELVDRGWLESRGSWLSPTLEGMGMADELARQLWIDVGQ